jgi:hypothetical protein
VTLDEFTQEMERLVNGFSGDYGKERVKRIWAEVNVLTHSQFKKLVDDLLDDCRFLPTITDIRKRIAKHRERSYYSAKRQHKKDAEEGWTRMPKWVKDKLWKK